MANEFEDRAREEKCRKICRVIQAEAVLVTKQATDHMWTELARKAGTTVPSETSRQRVIEILKEVAF